MQRGRLLVSVSFILGGLAGGALAAATAQHGAVIAISTGVLAAVLTVVVLGAFFTAIGW